MAEEPGPLDCWAIVKYDPAIGEKRLIAVYLDPEHAIADSGALQTSGAWVDVTPFPVHRAPQWSSYREPAWEQADADFDVPVQVPNTSTTSGLEA